MAVAISFIPPAEWSYERQIDLINEFNRQYWLTQVTIRKMAKFTLCAIPSATLARRKVI